MLASMTKIAVRALFPTGHDGADGAVPSRTLFQDRAKVIESYRNLLN